MNYTKNNTNLAFTLVELIVVVTILAILATIGFVSYSSYLTGVRDTNRLAQLVSIHDGLELYRTTKDLPLPDESVEIQANSETIALQGYAGSNTLETIDFTKGGVDPRDGEYFSYYLTDDRKYFQLMAFLEEETNITTQNTNILPPLLRGTEGELSLIPKTQAVDYSSRIPTMYGKKLGILTNDQNTPIQEIDTIQDDGNLDISSTTDTYIAYLTDEDVISGTGGTLVILDQINQLGGGLASSCASILRSDSDSQDGFYMINPSGIKTIDVFCDMTSAGGGWTLAVATSSNTTLEIGVGHLAGSDSYGDVSDAITGTIGAPGEMYKLADTDIIAIQLLGSTATKADYLFNQIGYNSYYSGGNNEYLTIENYTAEWNYGGKMPNSSTAFTVTSYRRSDGAIALRGTVPANVGCSGGEFGINCSLASYIGNGGGGSCDIDLRTTPATNSTWSGAFYIYMEATNSDNYLYACNGPQHSSTNRYKARYFIRESS